MFEFKRANKTINQPQTLPPSKLTAHFLAILEASCFILVVVALLDLSVRAMDRLEVRWDNFAYHIPFAAIYGGINVPFEMNGKFATMFQGFPPLAAFLQGLLWRVTGSINATGVLNYLALVGFFAYCHFVLKVRAWVVGMIALTTPLIIIHAATGYIDLFGNCLLAIGVSSLIYMQMYPQKPLWKIFLWGLAGLTASAWTKFSLLPIVVVVFVLFAITIIRRPEGLNRSYRQVMIALTMALIVSAIPYAKNIVLYGNPFWPYQVPIFSEWSPYYHSNSSFAVASEMSTPPPLKGTARVWIFINSLLEINHPDHYPDRSRWTLDQGGPYAEGDNISYRSGGFWYVGVIFYFLSAISLLLWHDLRKGGLAAFTFAFLIFFTGFLPVSNELRYFLYIPLLWACIVSMLYPNFKKTFPKLTCIFLIIMMGMFGYMVSENLEYYGWNPQGYDQIAHDSEAPKWWAQFEQGKVYCTLNMEPLDFLLTGPTMSEYKIVSRTNADYCPQGSMMVTMDGLQGIHSNKSLDITSYTQVY